MLADEEQMILEDMLYGPAEVFMVNVDYVDGTFSLFAFDAEELQEGFVEYLTHNSRTLGVDRIRYHANLLNMTPQDEWLFTTH